MSGRSLPRPRRGAPSAHATVSATPKQLPRELLPRGSSVAIGGRVYPTWALSSVAEHTLYMGEVPGPIPGAPTIVHEGRDDRNELKFLRLRRCRFARAVIRATSTMRSR